MLILTNITLPNWIDSENLRASKGKRFEVYCEAEIEMMQYIELTQEFIGELTSAMPIGHTGEQAKWGDFCLDTWDMDANTFDYSLNGKSAETKAYLSALVMSGIPPGYTGLCCCEDWDAFLPIVLACVFSHVAPYSINIYLPAADMFFYFHHTFSWGFYYREMNPTVLKIVDRIQQAGLRIEP